VAQSCARRAAAARRAEARRGRQGWRGARGESDGAFACARHTLRGARRVAGR
jgi:hypothetical protein